MMEISEDDINMEEYPTEIHDYLAAFEKSLGSVDEMLKTMMSVSRSELLQKLDPLEQAKLDLVSVYTLNSMFWVYLATQGINPKEHPVKQELNCSPCELQETHRDSKCINKTHIQAIRVHFFCDIDICQLHFTVLVHVGLPYVLNSYLGHQRNITVYHDFRPHKARLVKAMFLIRKEWPTF
ncbi:nuclear nucleic acid-binding protein C1D isoform X3 [Phaenicophaeus curvirostris]|uniref:nuclear nucleic acid-binding protein C1D isoform X3 n=1 Tax=Phaenicophaeus curvirostris TaxID=33595 RepID=UPI0037F0F26C